MARPYKVKPLYHINVEIQVDKVPAMVEIGASLVENWCQYDEKGILVIKERTGDEIERRQLWTGRYKTDGSAEFRQRV